MSVYKNTIIAISFINIQKYLKKPLHIDVTAFYPALAGSSLFKLIFELMHTYPQLLYLMMKLHYLVIQLFYAAQWKM